MLPVNAGTIAKIEGLDDMLKLPCVTDFIQYYDVGDTVKPEYIGTLSQHFGRLSMLGSSHEEILEAVRFINRILKITDTEGNEMHTMRFDPERVG